MFLKSRWHRKFIYVKIIAKLLINKCYLKGKLKMCNFSMKVSVIKFVANFLAKVV